MTLKKLVTNWCASCEARTEVVGQTYPYDHPDHYDGISEWHCLTCGRREGRWTGNLLEGSETEPRFGKRR